MNNNDYSTSFLVDQTPSECFEAINNVRGWWSEELVGSTDRLDAEFHYHFSDVHRARIKITEFIPDKKIVWHVVENYFKFTKDSTEWTGDDMLFEIAEKDGKTEVRFTQKGLTPAYECYDICSNAWGTYITGI